MAYDTELLTMRVLVDALLQAGDLDVSIGYAPAEGRASILLTPASFALGVLITELQALHHDVECAADSTTDRKTARQLRIALGKIGARGLYQ
jgi:hypothetical protein